MKSIMKKEQRDENWEKRDRLEAQATQTLPQKSSNATMPAASDRAESNRPQYQSRSTAIEFILNTKDQAFRKMMYKSAEYKAITNLSRRSWNMEDVDFELREAEMRVWEMIGECICYYHIEFPLIIVAGDAPFPEVFESREDQIPAPASAKDEDLFHISPSSDPFKQPDTPRKMYSHPSDLHHVLFGSSKSQAEAAGSEFTTEKNDGDAMSHTSDAESGTWSLGIASNASPNTVEKRVTKAVTSWVIKDIVPNIAAEAGVTNDNITRCALTDAIIGALNNAVKKIEYRDLGPAVLAHIDQESWEDKIQIDKSGEEIQAQVQDKSGEGFQAQVQDKSKIMTQFDTAASQVHSNTKKSLKKKAVVEEFRERVRAAAALAKQSKSTPLAPKIDATIEARTKQSGKTMTVPRIVAGITKLEPGNPVAQDFKPAPTHIKDQNRETSRSTHLSAMGNADSTALLSGKHNQKSWGVVVDKLVTPTAASSTSDCPPTKPYLCKGDGIGNAFALHVPVPDIDINFPGYPTHHPNSDSFRSPQAETPSTWASVSSAAPRPMSKAPHSAVKISKPYESKAVEIVAPTVLSSFVEATDGTAFMDGKASWDVEWVAMEQQHDTRFTHWNYLPRSFSQQTYAYRKLSMEGPSQYSGTKHPGLPTGDTRKLPSAEWNKMRKTSGTTGNYSNIINPATKPHTTLQDSRMTKPIPSFAPEASVHNRRFAMSDATNDWKNPYTSSPSAPRSQSHVLGSAPAPQCPPVRSFNPVDTEFQPLTGIAAWKALPARLKIEDDVAAAAHERRVPDPHAKAPMIKETFKKVVISEEGTFGRRVVSTKLRNIE